MLGTFLTSLDRPSSTDGRWLSEEQRASESSPNMHVAFDALEYSHRELPGTISELFRFAPLISSFLSFLPSLLTNVPHPFSLRQLRAGQET